MSLLKKYKWIFISSLVVLSSIFIGIKFAYKAKIPMTEKKVVFSGNILEFQTAKIAENSIVILSDYVTQLNKKEIMLGKNIIAQYSDSETNNFNKVSLGDKISIKGVYLGYDNLFEEYKLINCILITDE
jgi:hypothetical protein